MNRLFSKAASGLLAVPLVIGLGGCPSERSNVTGGAKAITNATVDFEGLAPGTIVSSLSSGAGINGAITGFIAVNGFTPALGAANSAVVFDSANPTGEDPDLGTPNEVFGGPGIGAAGETTNMVALGNVLILAEDLVDVSPADGLVDDPDDTAEKTSFFSFDFSNVDGVVSVLSMVILDVEDNEGGALIEVAGPALPPTAIPIPTVGNNGAETIAINAVGVTSMIVTFNGSGAIGEFVIAVETPDEPEGMGEGFRTQTQGGWGTRCRGNNPGCYRDANFDSCFAGGLVVGCEDGNTLTLTSSKAVEEFLPSGGTPSALAKDYVDPTKKLGSFAGQIVALTLSVGFDFCDPDFGGSNTALGDLVVIDENSACFGVSVSELLEDANAAFGGCDSMFSISDLNTCLTNINENFVDGDTDNGFLGTL